jgi:3-hydroxybutyryl-CoA dehydrogenase
MNIKKVGVLGCGLMGSGIAQVAATAGFDVVVLEQEQKFLDKGFAGIEKSLSRLVERGPAKGGLTAEQKTEAQSHLKGTLNMQDLADCDIVIEAIIENVERSARPTSNSARSSRRTRSFATNTSSISVTELMTATKRPERFIGLHFFNPVPMMKLVEVVKTIATAPEVYDAAVSSAPSWAKFRCAPATRQASSSTACWCRICWTRFARTKKASAPSPISTKP